MSSATSISEPTEAPGPHVDGNGHNPHLAHHFDTPEQQIASGKLGMWVFLATEILMFGGLFCAYSIYRHNHPDVFEYAHQWLNKQLGALNTIVLITSSLTMAWGVRLAQLGRQKNLIWCLSLTILGGYIFMGIKSIEYNVKYSHHLGLGKNSSNIYVPRAYDSSNKELVPGGGAPGVGKPPEKSGEPRESEVAKPEEAHAVAPAEKTQGEHGEVKPAAKATNSEYFDPNAGTTDAAKIRPVAVAPGGLAPKAVNDLRSHQLSPEQLEEEWTKLPKDLDKERTYTFFQIYFLMTGLHGIHVLVGMGLIFWILVRSCPKSARRGVKLLGLASVGMFLIYVGILVGSMWTWIIGAVIISLAVIIGVARMGAAATKGSTDGEFGPDYFAPVDLVGLYWHLVDLIWIFLFPLLYLIR